MGFWEFVSEPNNLEVFKVLGAGIAAIAVGGWAIYTFHKKVKAGSRSIRPAMPANPPSSSKPIPATNSSSSRSDTISYTISSIPPDLDRRVRIRIEDGNFHSLSAYVRSLLRADVQKHKTSQNMDSNFVSILRSPPVSRRSRKQ